MTDLDLEDLASELQEFALEEKKGGSSAREERIIAGFEDIQKFVEDHGRLPLHGEGRDIFERLYAVRLDRLRALPDCRLILQPLDRQGLLGEASTIEAEPDTDELAASLEGIDVPTEIETFVHIKHPGDINSSDEVARRVPCKEYDKFKPLFEQIQRELTAGIRSARRFQKDAEIKAGEFFILGGQKAYVESVGEEFFTEQNRRNARLRVIYDNCTENNTLLRSFQRALYKDETGRRITDPDVGPLFNDNSEDGDIGSGTIYVLRSLSTHPYIAEHRNVIHKIGVTANEVAARTASAKLDPTFLFAEVEVVTTYKLFNVNRMKLENLLHKFFDAARLDVEIPDNFGKPYKPREWFLVPLEIINEAIERIKDGSILRVHYDVKQARIDLL